MLSKKKDRPHDELIEILKSFKPTTMNADRLRKLILPKLKISDTPNSTNSKDQSFANSSSKSPTRRRQPLNPAYVKTRDQDIRHIEENTNLSQISIRNGYNNPNISIRLGDEETIDEHHRDWTGRVIKKDDKKGDPFKNKITLDLMSKKSARILAIKQSSRERDRFESPGRNLNNLSTNVTDMSAMPSIDLTTSNRHKKEFKFRKMDHRLKYNITPPPRPPIKLEENFEESESLCSFRATEENTMSDIKMNIADQLYDPPSFFNRGYRQSSPERSSNLPLIDKSESQSPVRIPLKITKTIANTSISTARSILEEKLKNISFKLSKVEAIKKCLLLDHPFKTKGFKHISEKDCQMSVYKKALGPHCVMLLGSIYENRPPTIFFPYPDQCHKVRETYRTRCFKVIDEEYMPKYSSEFSYKTVSNSLEIAGFVETYSNDWNLYWGHCPSPEFMEEMNMFQKTNHFPGSKTLGRKDNLWRNYSRMKNKFPNDYNFMPNTYLLDNDFLAFQNIQKNAEENFIWISKPVASCCGQGITLVNKNTKVQRKKGYLISDYIANPHLIQDLKYDLRIYCMITCIDPLKIYLFPDGLVRFATVPYSLDEKELKQKHKHLTNYSLNKNSPDYMPNTSVNEEEFSSKWSLRNLKKKYLELGIDYDKIMDSIKDIIIKTLISGEPNLIYGGLRANGNHKRCFEIYGFDILIDADLKPWLMEVNICPSLNNESPLDDLIKTTMLCDAFSLVGLRMQPKEYDESEAAKLKKKQNPDILTEGMNEKLTIDDWEMLFEAEEELYRRGNFELIFPLKDNIETYSKLFEFERRNNLVLWKYKKASHDILEKITRRISEENI